MKSSSDLVPKVLTAFLIFMACFYGIAAVVLLAQLIGHTARPKTGSGTV